MLSSIADYTLHGYQKRYELLSENWQFHHNFPWWPEGVNIAPFSPSHRPTTLCPLSGPV